MRAPLSNVVSCIQFAVVSHEWWPVHTRVTRPYIVPQLQDQRLRTHYIRHLFCIIWVKQEPTMYSIILASYSAQTPFGCVRCTPRSLVILGFLTSAIASRLPLLQFLHTNFLVVTPIFFGYAFDTLLPPTSLLWKCHCSAVLCGRILLSAHLHTT